MVILVTRRSKEGIIRCGIDTVELFRSLEIPVRIIRML